MLLWGPHHSVRCDDAPRMHPTGHGRDRKCSFLATNPIGFPPKQGKELLKFQFLPQERLCCSLINSAMHSLLGSSPCSQPGTVREEQTQ